MSIAVCQVSGGFDSAAALILDAPLRTLVQPLFFRYGQAYVQQEEQAARTIVSYVKTFFASVEPLKVVDVEIPKAFIPEMPATYVPMRNLVLGALSISYAHSLGADAIIVGNKTKHYRADDPYCYRDCSRAFYDALQNMANVFKEGVADLAFVMPLVDNWIDETCGMPKHEVLRVLRNAGMSFDIPWSCSTPTGGAPCRTCHMCEDVSTAIAKLHEETFR